jgi:TonB family protein
MKLSAPRSRYWAALALSFILHSLLGGGLVLVPKHSLNRQQSQTSVELMTPEELQSFLKQAADAKTKAQQIVSSDSRRRNDEKDPNARYLSEFDQKVVRESRAMKSGKFNNAGGKGATAAATQVKPSEAQNQSANQIEETSQDKLAAKSEIQTHPSGDLAVAPQTGLAAFNPSFRKMPVVPDPTAATNESSGDGREISATDDHLKDVPTGIETMLSTREFLYYSYYNRIKDKLRQYWEPKIKEKFTKIMRQGRTIASEGDKITRVIIILNEQGTLIRVQIVGRSGVTDLDDAAVEAFRAAAPFPNPPKGIVEPDGTIKIRWDFVLEA